MGRERKDHSNAEVTSILEQLLAENVTISAREVAKRHSLIASASAITRDKVRRELVETYKRRQDELKVWYRRVSKTSTSTVATQLERLQERITELERNEAALLRAHIALIAVVAEVGGTAKLKDFYVHFRELRESLHKLNAFGENHRKM